MCAWEVNRRNAVGKLKIIFYSITSNIYYISLTILYITSNIYYISLTILYITNYIIYH